MDWTGAVDLYCERTAAGPWNEPFNAWSNAAFLLAAVWGAVTAVRRGCDAWVLWLLIGLAALVGVGSFLFHVFANRWSELADTIPIWTFVAVYTLAAMRWIGGMAPRRVGLWAAIVLLAGVAMAVLTGFEGGDPAVPAAAAPPAPLNGSGQYAPALAALVVFSLVTGLRRHPLRAWVWGATAAFLGALVFRALDMRVCAAMPIGVHFLWHLFDGLMVALLLQLLIRALPARRAPAGA